MRHHLLALALALPFAAACGNDTRVDDGDETAGDDGGAVDANPAIDGRLAFVQMCSRCHGETGEGLAGKGPQVQNPVRGFATYTVRTGRAIQMGFMTPMDPYGADVLPDDVLAAMLDYLASAPKPTTGAGLYGRFCGNCHGADGAGGRVGEGVLGEADEAHEKIREGHGGTAYGARTKYMPSWPSTEISDAEIALIEAYLGSEEDDDD